ncbi:MAG TPA: PAS domain-containing protein, partial [Methanoregula sp.]|nr:PAS domain-containing protein [Methanoregula sp.]
MSMESKKSPENVTTPGGNRPGRENARPADEIARLSEKVRELEETLIAIRSGEVDAIIVPDGEEQKIYTLEGQDSPYRDLVENIREGALTLSRNGTILYANTQFSAMVKLRPETVTGTSLQDHICPAYLDAVNEGLRTISREPYLGRIRIYKGKGSLPVFLSMSPLSRKDDTKISVIVTDRSRDEEQIQLQARMLDAVADAVIAADPRGKIIYWNR